MLSARAGKPAVAAIIGRHGSADEREESRWRWSG